MNILLTTGCNRRCVYCFAVERISAGSSGRGFTEKDKPSGGIKSAKKDREDPEQRSLISTQDFEYAVGFAGSDKTIGILGGEPSLHPRFIELLEIAWAKGLCTKIFTNGLWPDGVVDEMKRRGPELGRRLHIVVNINSPEETPDDEQERQAGFLEELGPWCVLGYNICRVDFDPGFLVEKAERFRTKRELRMAVAQPLAGMDNAHVDLEEYASLSPALIRLAERSDEKGIRVAFDCGFVMCMFTPEQVGKLIMHGTRFMIRCSPVIDVGVDLSVWACFPLSTIGKGAHLKDFADQASIYSHFKKVFRPLYEAGAMEKCIDCVHRKRGRCTGGCAAHVYRRLNP